MILVDTSVWIDHLRRGNASLRALLGRDEAACHPFVVGELACGTLRRRREILELLGRLPMLGVVDHDEAMAFLEARQLPGRGLGWIDIHLLASAALAGVRLLTLDRRLAVSAAGLGIGEST